MPKNIAEKTKPFKVEKKELQILTKAQGKNLIESARQMSGTAGLMVSIALKTGMRLGEICGLKWDCVDFDNNIISVRQTVVATNHGPIKQNTTKTSNSYRNIPLPKSLIKELVEHRKQQDRWKETIGNKYLDNNFVLTNDYGHYIDPSYFSHRIFKKALENAGIDKSFRFHDCRHTHATWLLDADVNVKAVSERLGHSSVRITLDIYSHVIKTMQDKAVAAVEGFFEE